MTSIVHVDTEALRSQAQRLRRLAWEIETEHMDIRQALQRLKVAWEGPSAWDFLLEAYGLLHRLEANLEDLRELIRVLEREAQKWEDAERFWYRYYRQLPVSTVKTSEP